MRKPKPITPTPEAFEKIDRLNGRLPYNATDEEIRYRYQLAQAQTLIDTFASSPGHKAQSLSKAN